MSSWISLYPWWYVEERRRVERRFTDFRVSERELRAGVLVYKGTLTVDLGDRLERNPVLLRYSEETPYHVPQLFPLERLPEGDEWLVEDVVANHARRMPPGYRLHQMPAAGTRSGAAALCVVEAGTGQTAESFSGVDVLRRAKDVFKACGFRELWRANSGYSGHLRRWA